MRFDMKALMKNIFSAGLEKEDYACIQKDLNKRNLINLKGMSMLTAVYMLAMMASSFKSSISFANRIHFVWCFGICAGITIMTLLGQLRTKTATLIAIYLYLATIFAYGIAIGSTQTSQTAVSFLIFIMVGPLIFYDKPIRFNCLIWIFNIIFLFVSIKVKTPSARDTDIINGISYGIISCMLNTVSMVFKMKHILLDKKMQNMAEIDSLTNLKNRNCFEKYSQDYLKQAKKSVACIYIDVNGLHKLNNMHGHEAGDQMLRYFAEQIILLFGQDSAYRIGGDEYMVLRYDESVAIINQKIEELSNRMHERNYSISVGIASAPIHDLDMQELIKKADSEMYLSKKKYYERKGMDRRKV